MKPGRGLTLSSDPSYVKVMLDTGGRHSSGIKRLFSPLGKGAQG